MRYTLFALLSVFFLAACGQSGDVTVMDAYMFETPQTMPAAAVFMTIKNGSAEQDKLVDFQIEQADRTELHIMEMTNDIMKMRRVDRFEISAGEEFVLSPSGPHIMVFDRKSDFINGQTLNATAIFEKAGKIPVNIEVHTRSEHSSGHNH